MAQFSFVSEKGRETELFGNSLRLLSAAACSASELGERLLQCLGRPFREEGKGRRSHEQEVFELGGS